MFFASLEMSAVELSMRAVANRAQIDSQQLRTAYDDSRVTKVMDAVGWYGDLSIAIDERASGTAADVCYAARRQYPAPDLVIVDHLQLLMDGIQINYLSRWLGHSSIQTTLLIYLELVPDPSGSLGQVP